MCLEFLIIIICPIFSQLCLGPVRTDRMFIQQKICQMRECQFLLFGILLQDQMHILPQVIVWRDHTTIQGLQVHPMILSWVQQLQLSLLQMIIMWHLHLLQTATARHGQMLVMLINLWKMWEKHKSEKAHVILPSTKWAVQANTMVTELPQTSLLPRNYTWENQ